MKKLLCCLMLLSVIRLSADSLEALDIKVEQLKIANSHSEEQIGYLRIQARQWIEMHQENMSNEEMRNNPDGSYIELQRKFINLLQNHTNSGLSDTTESGRAEWGTVLNWMRENEWGYGWQGAGADQISVLNGIYYEQRAIKNRNIMIGLLENNREWGLSTEKCEQIRRQIVEARQFTGGTSPYNGCSEAYGFEEWTIFLLNDIRREKGLPEPGSDAYRKIEADSIACLDRQGFDTEKLEAFRRNLFGRIRRLTPAEEMPGFLQAIGFEESNTEEQTADIVQWRVRLLRSAHNWWLKSISTCNGEKVKAGLLQMAGAVGKFDQALQISANEAAAQIEAAQKLTNDVLSQIPLVNTGLTIQQIVSGAALSGEQVSAMNRILSAASIFGPGVLTGLRKLSPGLNRFLTKFASEASSLSSSALSTLGNKLGMSSSALNKVLAVLKKEEVQEGLDFLLDQAEGTVVDSF